MPTLKDFVVCANFELVGLHKDLSKLDASRPNFRESLQGLCSLQTSSLLPWERGYLSYPCAAMRMDVTLIRYLLACNQLRLNHNPDNIFWRSAAFEFGINICWDSIYLSRSQYVATINAI